MSRVNEAIAIKNSGGSLNGAQTYIQAIRFPAYNDFYYVDAIATEAARQEVKAKPGFYAPTLIAIVSGGTAGTKFAMTTTVLAPSGDKAMATPIQFAPGEVLEGTDSGGNTFLYTVPTASTGISGSTVTAESSSTVSRIADTLNTSPSSSTESHASSRAPLKSPGCSDGTAAMQTDGCPEPVAISQAGVTRESDRGQHSALPLALGLGLSLPLLALLSIGGTCLLYRRRKRRPDWNQSPTSATGGNDLGTYEPSKEQLYRSQNVGGDIKPKDDSHPQTELRGIPIHRPAELPHGTAR